MNKPDITNFASRIHAALPQTQCTRCGYPDCAGYAVAIAQGEAPINQCPPGGFEGVVRLAAITGLPATPLNPDNGLEGPRSVAVIDETWCIGCTLCLPACPTDAILGSNKMMHTVIEADCTGCELCIAVCPVDCISLENLTRQQTGWAAWSHAQAHTAGHRYAFHLERLNIAGLSPLLPMQPAVSTSSQSEGPSGQTDAERKQALIKVTLARAREKAKTQGLAQSSNK